MNERIVPREVGAEVRRVLDTSPSGAAITSKPGLTLFRNARFNELMRIPAGISDPIDIRRFFFSDNDKLRIRILLTGNAKQQTEFRFRAFDGREVWTILTLDQIEFAGQHAVLSWLFDITAREQLNVENSRVLLQTILDNISDGVTLWDKDFNWKFSNRKHIERQQYTPDLLRPGATGYDMIRFEANRGEYGQLDDVEKKVQEIAAMIRSGGRYARRTKSGFHIEFNYSQLADGSTLGLYRDITELMDREHALAAAKEDAERALSELRRTQEELIQAEKMAALGSLVAGVAHEINTPLGNTLTATSHLADQGDLLAARLLENRMRRTDLEQFMGLVGETTILMLTNLERAVELIQSFKQIAVDQTSGERRQFDLKAYIDEILLSLRPRLRKTRHEVEVDCPKDIIVDGCPGALSQVLTNFVLNSLLHAYGEDDAGHLSITVRQPKPDWIELSYADDGAGIPAEIIGRIYDPFFTTRRGSGGSGLGLHIVYNLVTVSLGGHISVRSEPGGGTRFLVRFPRVIPVEGDERTSGGAHKTE